MEKVAMAAQRLVAMVLLALLVAFPHTALQAQTGTVKARAAISSRAVDGFFSRRGGPEQPNDGVIIFLHGLGGNAQTTWKNAGGRRPWYELLEEDPVFDRNDIFVVDYPSGCSIGGGESAKTRIDGIVEAIDQVLRRKANGLAGYGRVYFVGHSLGGIIARAYLLERPEVAQKTKALFLFGTPMGGSEWATAATAANRSVVRCPLVRALQTVRGTTYLDGLQNRWLRPAPGKPRFGEQIRSYCGFETKGVLFSLTFAQVVPPQSARQLCTSDFTGINGDHLGIVKPIDRDADPHTILRRWFLEALPGEPVAPGNAAAVLATCSHERYDAQIKAGIERMMRKSGKQVSRTPPLPVDWLADYRHYLWTGKSPPELLVIHFSCFQDTNGTVGDDVWNERAKDFARLLQTLKPSNVKVLAFSTAFDGPVRDAMRDVGQDAYLMKNYKILADYKRAGRLATVRVSPELFIPGSAPAREFEAIILQVLKSQ